jgi:hypothetical protein
MEEKADTHVILIGHQRVPTPKRMQFAAAPITIGQKADKTNPFHDKFGVASVV